MDVKGWNTNWRHEDKVTKYAILLLNNEVKVDYGRESTPDGEREVRNDLFRKLWSRALLRISVDGGTNFLLKPGVKCKIPDIVCGDFDSVNQSTLQFFEEEGSKIIPTPDQDETDFTKAVKIALEVEKEREESFDAIIAINTIGGRPDHLLSNFHTLHKFSESGTSVFLCDIGNSISWVLYPGKHRIETALKASLLPVYNWCSLVPLTGEAVVTTTGLKWNLSKGTLKFGHFISTSNEFVPSSPVTIECTSPLLWSMKY